MFRRRPPVTRTPWLRRDQWDLFCSVYAGDDLPPSYGAWLETNQQALLDMATAGIQVRRVTIDVEQLIAWCKQRGRPVDPLSMMLFSGVVDGSGEDPSDPAPDPSSFEKIAELEPPAEGLPRISFYSQRLRN